MTAARIRIGISGWRYAPWRGVFYPRGLAQRHELAYASRALASIEINGTFYALQRPERFARWRQETPDDFVFAVKGHRYITHHLRLRDAGPPLANFLASGLLNLGEKLGPILWQLPPNFRYDEARLRDFLRLLPRDTGQALALARRRERARMTGRTALPHGPVRPLRHALEIRHESFRDPGFIALLREYGVALVVADTAGRWPLLEDATADFMYLRLHGDEALYASGYGDAALDDWARRIAAWARGAQPRGARRAGPARVPRIPRDVYCYFDNDIKAHAPFDAQALARRLGEDRPGAGILSASPRSPPRPSPG
ncbi:DUF72 domain-containing protein [Luteimonas huabeiensis]|uniref:DUF72 domain-containing protein n=1 Tax=Luteimonas huabeiensis TaxID=1244513 RepID=UPI0004B3F70E|nr:DUF72 domain-containing protein [Luteimonas huabeiensis]